MITKKKQVDKLHVDTCPLIFLFLSIFLSENKFKRFKTDAVQVLSDNLIRLFDNLKIFIFSLLIFSLP